MSVTAIIVAAGVGKRMGTPTPKQFLDLSGQPLLAHTLRPFESIPEIDEMILLAPADWQEHCRTAVVEKHHFKKVRKIITGGMQRQDSIALGLEAASEQAEIIVLHDGVRPLITRELIEASVQTARAHGAAIVAVPVGDTLKRATPAGFVNETLSREHLWLAQTPQTFRREVILKAYEAARRDGFYGTDDAMLVERCGFAVKILPGSMANLKVTTPEDMRLAELVLEARSRMGSASLCE